MSFAQPNDRTADRVLAGLLFQLLCRDLRILRRRAKKAGSDRGSLLVGFGLLLFAVSAAPTLGQCCSPAGSDAGLFRGVGVVSDDMPGIRDVAAGSGRRVARTQQGRNADQGQKRQDNREILTHDTSSLVCFAV